MYVCACIHIYYMYVRVCIQHECTHRCTEGVLTVKYTRTRVTHEHQFVTVLL